MHSTTTANELTPSELEKCRENLRKQWKNHKVDEALLKRAWDDAHSVATVLYKNYGANKVAVFGSLADRVRFSKYSDIDIVVWGVSYNRCLDALWETEGLSAEFKIDIINVKNLDKLFRERILNEAIPINIEEIGQVSIIKETDGTENSTTSAINKVNREKLIQLIIDERDKIKKTVERIGRALEKIEVLPIDAREFIEIALGTDLEEVYTGIEKLFQRIAKEIDKHTPSGERWHSQLLSQMAERNAERPPVVSENTHQKLQLFLKLRHKIRNIYGDQLDYTTVEKHAKQVSTLYENVSEELDIFITFLNET